MRTTQKQRIVLWLQRVNDWQPAYKLRGLNTPFGFLGHQSDRRCRELAQDGKIDHKIENGFSYYRAKPIIYQTFTIRGPTGEVEGTIQRPVQTKLI